MIVRKALIVDDDYEFAQFAKILMESYGFESIISLESEPILEMAEATKPDVILMDIHMPELSGIEAIDKLRANPATEKIPVILCSMTKDRREVENALKAEATQFLHKPLKTGELKECLDKALPADHPSDE